MTNRTQLAKMYITFKAEIFRKSPGCFLARANELQIASNAATTQRGALKKLKDDVRHYLSTEAKRGTLSGSLDALGFMGNIGDNKVRLCPYNSKEISLPLRRQIYKRRPRS